VISRFRNGFRKWSRRERTKKKNKKRAFKLRRGGSAAITRRPPRRNSNRPPFSIGEEDERGESIFVGKEKREKKDKRKMRDFSLTAFIYAAHDPNPV